MEVQEIDPAALAVLALWGAGGVSEEGERALMTPRAEDIFADALTRIPLDTLTKAFLLKEREAIIGYSGYRRDTSDGSVNPHAAGATGPHAKILVWVNPAFRRRGVGARLLRHAEAEAARDGVRSLDCYPRLEPGVAEFAAAHGWREAYREIVQIADAARVPAPPPAAAAMYDFVRGADCDAARAERLYEVFHVSSPEIAAWWSLPNFYEAVQKPRRFNGFAVASEGVQGVGFAWGLDAEPDAVFHEFTGVRPEWRGQGIASALKHTLAQAAARAGLPRLLTCNRVGNDAMFAINRRLGYEAVVEMALFQKTLTQKEGSRTKQE